MVVGVSHWVDGTSRVELDLLVLQQRASQAVRDLRPAVPQVAEVLGGPDGGTWLSPGGLSARELSALDGVVLGHGRPWIAATGRRSRGIGMWTWRDTW